MVAHKIILNHLQEVLYCLGFEVVPLNSTHKLLEKLSTRLLTIVGASGH